MPVYICLEFIQTFCCLLGIQVLKGDIRPAIETHEMLYQVIKKHNFLPEVSTVSMEFEWTFASMLV